MTSKLEQLGLIEKELMVRMKKPSYKTLVKIFPSTKQIWIQEIRRAWEYKLDSLEQDMIVRNE